MKDFINVNDGEFLHLLAVKRFRHITDDERASLAKLENVDADRFHTRIDEANGNKSYAPETIDQIAAQGVALVQIDKDTFVPRDNIGRVKEITNQDRKAFEKRTGRSMPKGFQSRVETKAGMVLSKAEASTIMHRMGRPYRAKERQSPVLKDMTQQRDTVMAKAASKSRSTKREHSREPQN